MSTEMFELPATANTVTVAQGKAVSFASCWQLERFSAPLMDC